MDVGDLDVEGVDAEGVDADVADDTTDLAVVEPDTMADLDGVERLTEGAADAVRAADHRCGRHQRPGQQDVVAGVHPVRLLHRGEVADEHVVVVADAQFDAGAHVGRARHLDDTSSEVGVGVCFGHGVGPGHGPRPLRSPRVHQMDLVAHLATANPSVVGDGEDRERVVVVGGRVGRCEDDQCRRHDHSEPVATGAHLHHGRAGLDRTGAELRTGEVHRHDGRRAVGASSSSSVLGHAPP